MTNIESKNKINDLFLIEIENVCRDVLGCKRGVDSKDLLKKIKNDKILKVLFLSIEKRFNVLLSLEEINNCFKLEDLASLIKKALYQKLKDGKNIIIPKAKPKKNYSLSHAQRRMFVLYKLESDSSFYNICHARIIKGGLNIETIKKSFKLLIARHEILRTNFMEISGEPVQIIREEGSLRFKIYDLEKVKNVKRKEEKEKNITRLITRKSFKLESDPLLRVTIIKKNKNQHILIISMHHIISDGWSMNIFYRELIEIYNSILENRKANLPELSIQYKDYAEWEQSKENQKRLKKQEKYWLKELSGELPVLNLPTDKPRPAMQTYNGDTKYISIDKNITKKLKQVSEQNNTTLFTLLFAVFNVFLHKISGQKDIIVGTPTTDRGYQEIENNIGLFVNTLAIRTGLDSRELFEEFLEKINNNILESIANKEYPFEELVEKLNPKRDMSRNPLFSVLFQIFQNNNENNSKTIKQLHNTKSILKFSNNQITKFDMSIKAIETIKDNLTFVCEYNTNLFNQETIERFLIMLKTLTQNIVNNSKQKINNLEIISKQEKQKLLHTFNNTKKEYPKNKTIQELFEEQVEKTPKKIAVEFKDKTLTYEELNKKANQLAHYLRKEEKVKPNDVVAIMVKRSFEMIIGIFAIIKSGGAYLPISPEAPPERIKYYLNNSNAKILLTQDKTKKEVKISSSKELKVLTIDNLSKITEKEIERKYKDKNPKIINKSNDLIYVIYTSGSTGKPKGVMIRHFSLLNRLNWMKNNFKLDKNDKILQKTNYTFDVSVWELFLWFLNGASLVFLPPKAENNPEIILKTILKNRVSLVHFVPSMFNEFLKHLEKTKYNLKHFSRLVFTSGENLHLAQVEKFFKITKRANKQKNNLGLFNLYGPTEATVDVSYFNCSDIKKTKKVYIGKPIDNHQLYILNQDQKLQPIGIPGELYISGDGLAKGYINDKNQAKQVFLPHPFKKDTRIYKTGDLAKMHPDGNIEILGRIDHQIKIRGYRIEPEEIEASLKKHNNIKDVIVIAKEIKQKQNKQEENKNKQEQVINDKYLVAYYTSNNRKKINPSKLKEKLKQNLPDYMIPKFFIHLKQFPLNQNGKLDRLNLPEPKEKDLDKNKYIEPKTEIEKKVAKIWQEVLNVKRVSRNDNFFNLGGHSLKAIQVLSRINSQFKIDLGLKEVFDNQELYELSLSIRHKLIALAKIKIDFGN
jgi:amino acid adenylation domain-containing protein